MNQTNKRGSSNGPALPSWQRFAGFFDRRGCLLALIGLGLTVLLSLLLFDAKVNIGGDDSAYLMRAYRLIHSGVYPSYQGPLYPMVLALVMLVTGFKVWVFKLLSVAFTAGGYWVLYRAFRGRVAGVVLYPALILTALCPAMAYYASQTYSEPFFMLLQASLLLCLVRWFADPIREDSLRQDFRKYLMLGLLLFLMGITRTAGYFAIPAVVLFFLCYGKWRPAVYTLLSFGLFNGLFSLVKSAVWDVSGPQFADQLKQLTAVDPYNQALGAETFGGYMKRLLVNAEQYLSGHTCVFLGWSGNVQPTGSVLMTFVVCALGVAALVLAYRRNRALFAAAVYTVVVGGCTFLSLQTSWNQDRLILALWPLLLIVVLGGVWMLFTEVRRMQAWWWLFPVLVGVMGFTTFRSAAVRVSDHAEYLGHLFDGEPLYGFTPDWEHYMQAAEWAGQNIPAEENIACRKPEIAFVYGGREFFGIYSVPQQPLDELLARAADGYRLVGIDVQRAGTPAIADFYRNHLDDIVSFVEVYNDQGGRQFVVFRLPGGEAVPVGMESDMVAYLDGVRSTHTVSAADPDVLLQRLAKAGVRYVMLASLRVDPSRNTGQIITTVQRYLFYLSVKYPAILGETLYTAGTSEPTAIVRLNY
ncbi:MAG: glycosyltransferase family 39 protein [Rikenellaceae bacterium]|nr:glycosyltransferase family 39 protein [Rikenellaceae bacterium]